MSESSFVLEDLKKQMILRHSKILESVHLHHVFFTAKFQSFQNLPSEARKFFWTPWYHLFRFGSKAFDYVVGLLKWHELSK